MYDDPQLRNEKELENRVEEAVMDIHLSCSVQLVRLFDSMPVGIAHIIEKKSNKVPYKTISGVFFIAVQKALTRLTSMSSKCMF